MSQVPIMNNSLITAQNISLIMQNKPILHDISLKINKNEFITIIGPNGAGKSMLLKSLMGLCKLDKGKVIKAKNLKIGYVPQSLVIDKIMPITVRRFLTLAKNYDDISFQNTVNETNIESLLNKQLSDLSGGETQRVLLARSLLGNPNLLILDEPAQNLDISGQLSFYKLLETIYAKRNLSILMVSHDLHMVMASSKKVICLYHHICCAGKPKEITKDPEFIALFGNDMAKMMAFYQHSHNHCHDKEDCNV